MSLNLRTYENFYLLSFKHSLNKIFVYIYCIRIYSTNMCIKIRVTINFTEIDNIYLFP